MRSSGSWKTKIRHIFSESTVAGPLAVLIGIFVLLSLFVPKFLSFRSITGIINASTLTGALAIGMTMLMISGEFDMSVGALMAVGGYLFGGFAMAGKPILGLVLAILVPSLLGAINGLILVSTGIPSFIVTLGTKYLYRGLLWVITAGTMLQTVERLAIYNFFNGRLEFLNQFFKQANFRNSLIWLIMLVILFQIILSRTRFGNHVFAVGGNAGAALGQGVNVKKVKILCFATSGLMAGISGIFLFSQYYTVRVASGDGMDLYAIAASVVGGTLITGGAGSIWGALIGALIISMLRTGVVLMNISFYVTEYFQEVL
jgi:simple sugar transport system permease protein